MKEEQILRNTEIIVKFMGLKTYKHYEQVLFKETQPSLWKIDVAGRDVVSSEFHSSWDWLMPVVNKAIKTIDKRGYPHGIGGGIIPVAVLYDLPLNTPIEKVYVKIVAFINFHNKKRGGKIL